MLGLPSGFWGLVDQGMEVSLIDNQGTLVKDGRPLTEHPEVDLSDLRRAEDAVALLGPTGMTPERTGDLVVLRASSQDRTGAGLGPAGSALGFRPPPGTTTAQVRATRQRLHRLGRQWRDLDDGGAITLEFMPPTREAKVPRFRSTW